MTERDTRKALIDAGLHALRVNGYDGVGLGPVLALAGVPKGSFYHFFRSKEDFACAVLDAYAERYRALRQTTLTDLHQPPLTRLEAYFTALEGELRAEQPLGGCLYGVMAQTMGARSPAFQAKVASLFADWEQTIAEVLRAAQDSGDLPADLDPQEQAAFLIDAYEGALLRIKADGSFAPLTRFKRLALRPLLQSVG